MPPLPTHPKLRWPIELRMVPIEQGEALVLQCPLGVTEKPLLLVKEIAPVVVALDGTRSTTDILQKFTSYGLSESLLNELLTLLDAHLFLETLSFKEAADKIRSSFLQLPYRPPALAGNAYPLTPEELRPFVREILTLGNEVPKSPTDSLIGVMSPHIDYHRGKRSYGESYRAVENGSCDLIVLIGTSHQYSTTLFQLTPKDFHTPLGVLSCATEVVQKLAARHGVTRSFADEYLHRREHSLELQTPFLATLFPRAQIIPLLVGSFHDLISSGKLPHEKEEYLSFISALHEVLNELRIQNKKITVVAGVDMAHVGPQFGDSSLTSEMMEEVRIRDHQYLDTLVRADKLSLFRHIEEDGDKRRICGFPTMYTVLDLYERLGISPTARLLGYHQAVDYSRGCAVTFAGMTFFSNRSEH